MNATLTILHPGIESPQDAKPRLAPRLVTLQGKRVALLDNGKVNAGALLAAIAARLRPLGIAEIRSWKKQHAAKPGEKVIPDLIRWKPDLALTAIGD